MAPVRLLLGLLLLGTSLVAQAPAGAPLPDRETFFAEVRKRLASNDLIQSRYSYRERSTELKLNPFGRMGTGPVLVYDVYPHPNDELTYRRLVEREGLRLSPEELAEQDRKYRERLTAWQRRLDREGNEERHLRLQRLEEGRLKDEARAREALQMFDFAIEGRDLWEGQPAIIIGFTPRPDAQPRTREGRIARAFTGRAWVHEFEYEVMNVEARAIDDVSFGWGMIAKLYKGSTARFTRRRVNGVWLPVESRFEGEGRAILVRRITIDFERDYSDYVPFEPSDLPARLGWER